MMVDDEGRIKFYSLSQIFLEEVSNELQRVGVVLEDHWMWDHICYRVETLDRYAYWLQRLSQWGDLLIESEVGGRLIATFKLSQPIKFKGKTINIIELPAPKPHAFYHEGFEHIEIVCDESFDVIKKKYPRAHFNALKTKKILNPELEVKLEKYAIKFHHCSLESIIKLEQNARVFSALKETNILKYLEAFTPLVAGTFPLGISTADSDVDIVLSSSDFNLLSEMVQQKYGSYEGFCMKQFILQDQPSWICQFQYKDVPFELFAQATESLHQNAYRHFQIEERLLQLGGENLRQKILKLRGLGCKTEPAFAKVLALVGDPYESLLNLHKETEKVLNSFINKNSF